MQADTEATHQSAWPQLNAIEARILGCLIEKEATTPEQYPLTQNAVQMACNQKTSREPVMDMEPGEVGHALRRMEERKLVRSHHAARAQRYSHLAAQTYSLTAQQQAVICLLLLRGPQTLHELLARSERLARFADADDLRHTLDRLIERDPPLIQRLPRTPGQREERYVHLLCGPVDVAALAAAQQSSVTASSGASALEERFQRIEERLDALEAILRERREAAPAGQAEHT